MSSSASLFFCHAARIWCGTIQVICFKGQIGQALHQNSLLELQYAGAVHAHWSGRR